MTQDEDEGKTVSFGGAQIDQAAAGDINNYYGEDKGRELNAAEKREIHLKVERLSATTNDALVEIRSRLKTLFNAGINELRLEQRDAVNKLLDAWNEIAELQHNRTQQSAELDENAGAMTKVVQQVTALSAQLKLSTAHEQQYLQQLAEAKLQAKQYQEQLAEAQRQAEQLRLAKPLRPLCQTCSTAAARLARSRRGLVLAAGVAVVAILATTYLGYQAYTATNVAQAAEARLSVCEFDGKPYTVGSIVANDGAADLECVRPEKLALPYWQAVKPPPVKPKAQSRKRPRPTTPEPELPVINIQKELF
ncbi:hypothetical protein R0381_002438 [Jeongeupia wiesaeckerbachi]|uniref:hypothetical protein n=1 Tax=Jeongeupia wiesaeckerbachi TaxID=3051218 RepID=UPI003D802CA5